MKFSKSRLTSILSLTLIACLIALTGCERNKDVQGCMQYGCNNYDANAVIEGECFGCAQKFTLYGIYHHSPGSVPGFTISEMPEEISVTEVNANLVVPYVDLTFEGLKMADQESSYLIDEIIVEEKNENGEWQFDSEFTVSQNNHTDLGVVLCLDSSESLGSDFENVKTYANQFVEDIFNITSNAAQIAVISFSTDTSVLQFQSQQYIVNNFISTREQGQFTRMYDAIQGGINLFEWSNNAFDSQAIVTFTDGKNNLSAITNYNVLTEQMNNKGIRSYTVGLRGNDDISESILDSLAVNGEYQPAESVEDLSEIFTGFSRQITDVYNVVYTRTSEYTNKEVRITILARPK